MLTNYSAAAAAALRRAHADVGDRLEVRKGGTKYEGLLMPRTESGDSSCIVLKLGNGYNIGVRHGSDMKIRKLAEAKKAERPAVAKSSFDPNNKIIAVISTGGTIASRVDYQTGGVVPAVTAEDIINSLPELSKIANLRCSVVLQVSSEDITFSDYSKIAKAAAAEIKKGCDGVIITHGTDTMHYTAAALSFALQDLPVPVLLVGSQRSSDRGSSDAAMNMVCAANFIINSDFSGVAVCMHGTTSDDYCSIIAGTRARKLHTSRRDAFRAVNSKPVARAYPDGTVEITGPYAKRDKLRKLRLAEKFEPKVGLLKIYPGISEKAFDFYKGYKGIVVEGTGLGHVPTANKKLMASLGRLAKKMPVVMSSQCINGRVNMDVYAPGRNQKKLGLISAEDMTPETALVKLSWLLANDKKGVRGAIRNNLVGEISERRELDDVEEW